MKLSTKHANKFLRRAQRRFKVTNDFLLSNMAAMLKFIKYAITPRIILKRKLIRKKNRVYLKHNYLRKLIFDPSKLKKTRFAKRLRSQWSKRLVMYLRRSSIMEYVEEEEVPEEGNSKALPQSETQSNSKDVSEQLKEQLELLKSGKRTVPLFEEPNSCKPVVESTQDSLRLSSIEMIDNNEAVESDSEKENADEEETVPPVPLLTAVHITEEEFKGTPTEPETKRSNGNFLDMLISKVKHKTGDVCEAEVPSPEKSMEPPKQYNNKLPERETFDPEGERENSNSSSDFFGFEDNERVLGNFPGMLSTPIVRKRDSNSAFVSETLNAYMRANSLESAAAVNYPQKRPDDGLVTKHSIPPKLDMPALPEGLQGLRTVAERRVFLQKTRNIKYCIINNVATIFRELQKHSKGHRIYKQAIESVIASSSVPMTRQGWKAAAWLLTDLDNYYCQTIKVDDEENVRLPGGRGNFQSKFRKAHSNIVKQTSRTACPKDCIDRTTFRSLRPMRTPEKRVKLNQSSQIVPCKPCPLSHKILQRTKDEESVFTGLDIVRMPKVELEVFPQLQKPLSEVAKRYLQLILPYEEISREWAEFSVSTLVDSKNSNELATKFHKSFTFRLPYANDRNHVIIRRVYNRYEEFDDQFVSSDYTFRKELDQNKMNGEPIDSVAMECADVLSDMLDSVAIACSENSFIKYDPDVNELYGGNEDFAEEKSVKKIEPHLQQTGANNKKQSRLLNELKRLNATVIDAATSKSEEDGTTCGKESCQLGCVCASLNEGTAIRQHCGRQRCVFECKCKCPSIMRLETDGRKITTEDAFMLRRQATAKLARVEKEFTSTIVLTGNETLLINESQYDKKRRCTKVPKRYGDFVEHDDSDLVDTKPSTKRTDPLPPQNFPLEPVLVNEKIYSRLKHCSVNVKKLKNVKDLAPWCMVHMVYKCFCKGHATLGNPIIIEKQEEVSETAAASDESVPKIRSLYSFEKEDCNNKTMEKQQTKSSGDENSDTCDGSDFIASFDDRKVEKRGRISDNIYIETYENAKANHCRRVVPIPRNIYKRRNKKRVAHVQLFIAENENEKTIMRLNEHILRSVYYHKDLNEYKYTKTEPVNVKDNDENIGGINSVYGKKIKDDPSIKESKSLLKREFDLQSDIPFKKLRKSQVEENTSELFKDESISEYTMKESPKKLNTPKYIPSTSDQITIPKISQIFSLNTGTSAVIDNDTPSPVPTPAVAANQISTTEPSSAIEMVEAPSEEMALAHGLSADAFKNVFKQVIKNMNNLVSKKMQDIDMALRRESKAIPAPNAEILCIIRWNNFLEAYLDGFVYLWEVRTTSLTFLAATIKPIMPLVMNALSVVNIQTIERNKLPLLGRMLIDRKRSACVEGLAVVMQGQKLYWIVKGFLRPDKTRVCPKPTPETHPLLTRKINVLCRLLINNQFNEHKKRRDAVETNPMPSPQMPIQSASPAFNMTEQQAQKQQQQQTPPSENLNTDQNTSNSSTSTVQPPQPPTDPGNISLKLKVLPMQRNISDQATVILEQMVSQAYGFVRTNISFRKIRSSELPEIFPPTKLSSNHHWLVLDISNDFSHIFIPELKDLLTLDRIQKVVSYAAAKNRIVKMQFSPKSIFNAYVTPRSQRKLYFGPFRQSVTPPKLVLLQSVDGQMMLREVYEARHNIVPKTTNTTAFWVVQKSGRIFLDVEQDSGLQNEVNPSVGRDIQQPSSVNLSSLNNFSTGSVPQSAEVQQNNNQNASLLPVQQNSEVTEQTTELAQPLQKESETTNYLDDDDDDDDCVIVDEQQQVPPEVAAPPPIIVPTAFPQIVPAPTSGGAPEGISNFTVPSTDAAQVNSDRINYTISYGGENSSLVVIQNSVDPTGSNVGMPETIQNSFTILSSNQQSPAEFQTSSLQQKAQEIMPVNAIADLPPENCRPMSFQAINNINPGEIILTFPTTDPNTNVSIPAQHLTNVTFQAPVSATPMAHAAAPSESLAVTQNTSVQKLEKEPVPISEQHISPKHFKEIQSKWNKNITIKKLPTTSTTTQKPLKVKPIYPSKVTELLPTQEVMNIKEIPTGVMGPYGWVPSVNSLPTAIQPQQQQRPAGMHSQQMQRVVTGKIITPQQNIQPRGQGGLIVRTPSTINTSVRNQIQKITPMSAGVKQTQGSLNSMARVQPPAAVNQVVRLPKPVNTAPNRTVTAITTSSQQLLRKSLPDSTQIQKTTVSPHQILKKTNTTGQPPSIIVQQRVRKSLPNSIQSQLALTQQQFRKTTPDPVQSPLVPSPGTSQFRKILPDSTQMPASPTAAQQIVYRKSILDSGKSKQQYEAVKTAIANNRKLLIKPNANNQKTAISSTQPPKSDPLYISDQQIRVAAKPSQSKIPNTVTLSSETPRQNTISGHVISKSSPNLAGIKRNAFGTPISPSQFQIKSAQNMLPTKVSPSVSKTIDSAMKDEPVKGIPIELPRMKKFAIGTSHKYNTTVITSGPSESKCKKDSDTVDTSKCEDVTVPSTQSQPISAAKVVISASPTTATAGSSNSNAEYGYFFANIDGLPKFVVKRVGEDYLIKVPNFNGILKLAGLSTVHNYLNQYTIQKCGKTPKEIENLKWSFKMQDRSKLNLLSKSSSSSAQGSSNTNTQKLNKNTNEPTASSPPASTTTSMKPQNNSTFNESIDLSDE